MRVRPPQLPLRLNAPGSAVETAVTWGDGTPIAYLGAVLTLQLGSQFQETTLAGSVLYLPLPPNASERQIQDRAESWLRAAAATVLSDIVTLQSARLNRTPPRCRLSFAARASWVVVDGADLRCNWRIIAQPVNVIEQLVVKALASMPAEGALPDLFGALAA